MCVLQQHLVLEVVDAESGAVVGKSLYPVMERSVKPRRLPVYLCEAGGGGADEQGRKRGPCIGEWGPLPPCVSQAGRQLMLRRRSAWCEQATCWSSCSSAWASSLRCAVWWPPWCSSRARGHLSR